MLKNFIFDIQRFTLGVYRKNGTNTNIKTDGWTIEYDRISSQTYGTFTFNNKEYKYATCIVYLKQTWHSKDWTNPNYKPFYPENTAITEWYQYYACGLSSNNDNFAGLVNTSYNYNNSNEDSNSKYYYYTYETINRPDRTPQMSYQYRNYPPKTNAEILEYLYIKVGKYVRPSNIPSDMTGNFTGYDDGGNQQEYYYKLVFTQADGYIDVDDPSSGNVVNYVCYYIIILVFISLFLTSLYLRSSHIIIKLSVPNGTDHI